MNGPIAGLGTPYVVHLAGDFNGRVQSCLRCRVHLTYYGNCIFIGEQPMGWAFGALVAVSPRGQHAYELEDDRELRPDEELCPQPRKEG